MSALGYSAVSPLACSHAGRSSSSHWLAAPVANDSARLAICTQGRQPFPALAAQQAASCRPYRHSSRRTVATRAAVAAPAVGTAAPAGMRTLYPQLSAHDSGYLKVSQLHTLYYEVYGNPRGVPAVVVHGGPGAGCWPNHARFFDPAHYRIILVDQRGCGRSTPYGCLAGNTTAELVNDLEQLRRKLGVQQWLMLGGSWGVTLTLAYAQAFPLSVLGIILRGVCLMRPQEIHWMFGGGAAALKPMGWSRFLGPLSADERANPLQSYYARLLSPDVNVRSEAAKSWSAWEMSVGFSNAQNVAVWDGQQWSEQPSPAVPSRGEQQQQPGGQQMLPPPPRPLGPAAVSASAAAAGGLMPLLHRDISGSSWFSTLQQQSHQQTCKNSTSVPVSSASAQQRYGNKASLDSLQRPLHRRNGGPATPPGSTTINNCTIVTPAAAGQQLTAEQELIERGLQHRGFREHGSAQALLEAHYSIHAAFLQQQPLLDHMDRVRHIPCVAVQGQWDLVCPPTTAVEVGQSWPEMELRLVSQAGHSMYDPAIAHELVTATDRMRVLQSCYVPPAGGAAATAAQLLTC